jgi:hypothetical protein
VSVPTGSEAANEAGDEGEETEEEGFEEDPPVDIGGDIYRDGDGEASYLSSFRLTGMRKLLFSLIGDPANCRGRDDQGRRLEAGKNYRLHMCRTTCQ